MQYERAEENPQRNGQQEKEKEKRKDNIVDREEDYRDDLCRKLGILTLIFASHLVVELPAFLFIWFSF